MHNLSNHVHILKSTIGGPEIMENQETVKLDEHVIKGCVRKWNRKHVRTSQKDKSKWQHG